MFFKKINPGQEPHLTIIELKEDDYVVPASIGSATENNENVGDDREWLDRSNNVRIH